MSKSNFKLPSSRQGYIYGSPETFLQKLPPSILDSLSDQQLAAIREMLVEALPKSSPKLVDIRWSINLIFAHYYVVFLVGRDRREKKRYRFLSSLTKVGNTITYAILVMLVLFMLTYTLKSWVGIDIFPDKHLDDFIEWIFDHIFN